MKVKRTISIPRMISAFIIAALIFGLGILLGFLIDYQRVQWSEKQTTIQRLDYDSLQWQYLYLSSAENKEESCILLHAAFEKSVNDLGASLEKIQAYSDQTQINEEQYALLERGYLIDNLKYWLLARKTKEECGADYVNILYFFSADNCPICPDQGVILTHYKKKYGENLLIFPINTDFSDRESSVKIIEKIYEVKKFPSIVVEDELYEGVVPLEDLGEIICKNFDNKTLCIE